MARKLENAPPMPSNALGSDDEVDTIAVFHDDQALETGDLRHATILEGGGFVDTRPSAGGLSTAELLEKAGMDASSLEVDGGAYENLSTRPVHETAVAYTPQQIDQLQLAAAAQSVIANPSPLVRTQVTRDLSVKKSLDEIASALKTINTPDVTSYVGEGKNTRKIHIPGDIRDVPNRLNRKKSMDMLGKLIGEQLKNRVMVEAMKFGFKDKPCLWLSQQLIQHSQKMTIWDDIPPQDAYDEELDGDKQSVYNQAITSLFSYDNAEKIQWLARGNKCGVLHVLRALTQMSIDAAVKAKKPANEDDEYESMHRESA